MINEKAKLFKVLSDPGRLRILKMLQVRPLCVCEITEILNLAASTVSKHLSVLKESGFIKEEREGKWINYEINHFNKDPRISAILASLDFWIADEKTIKLDKQYVLKVDRNEVCGR